MAYEMILESKVIYSKKFINLLSKMKTNKLAKELLNLYSKDVDTLYTLCDEFEFPITRNLRNRIDWNCVFSVMETLKTTYNENMMRFVKSHMISKAIQKASDGYLKYVNKTGYDFVTENNEKIELKSGIKIFQKRKQQTEVITIMNTNGQSTDTKVFTKTFDYLLLIEPGMAAITTWEKMRPYIKPRGDSFKAQIPFTAIEIFKQSDTVMDFNESLPDIIEDAMDKTLQSIFDRVRGIA
jgi:hypothetical protein